VSDEDEVFADLGEVAALPAYTYPGLDRLPYIGYDIIHRLCGLDMHDESVPMPRKLAANEWFWRRAAGQKVTLEQVYRGGSIAGMDTGATADPPTAGAPTPPAASSDTASPSGSDTRST
jgi:hypothetical protein